MVLPPDPDDSGALSDLVTQPLAAVIPPDPEPRHRRPAAVEVLVPRPPSEADSDQTDKGAALPTRPSPPERPSAPTGSSSAGSHNETAQPDGVPVPDDQAPAARADSQTRESRQGEPPEPPQPPASPEPDQPGPPPPRAGGSHEPAEATSEPPRQPSSGWPGQSSFLALDRILTELDQPQPGGSGDDDEEE